MNIHLRATGRLLKNMFIPALVGAGVGVLFHMLPVKVIIWSMVAGILVLLMWLFYSWTLDQIRNEDALKSINEGKASQ